MTDIVIVAVVLLGIILGALCVVALMKGDL